MAEAVRWAVGAGGVPGSLGRSMVAPLTFASGASVSRIVAVEVSNGSYAQILLLR
jgi:hypothetical protein